MAHTAGVRARAAPTSVLEPEELLVLRLERNLDAFLELLQFATQLGLYSRDRRIVLARDEQEVAGHDGPDVRYEEEVPGLGYRLDWSREQAGQRDRLSGGFVAKKASLRDDEPEVVERTAVRHRDPS